MRRTAGETGDTRPRAETEGAVPLAAGILGSRLDPGLHLVATPIGTARDITLRALDVLNAADVLAAEDTRTLRHLMAIHGIPLRGRRILAWHDHSPERTTELILAAIAEGGGVAYCSDAGTPLVADPGFALARAVSAAGGAGPRGAGRLGAAGGADDRRPADRPLPVRGLRPHGADCPPALAGGTRGDRRHGGDFRKPEAR